MSWFLWRWAVGLDCMNSFQTGEVVSNASILIPIAISVYKYTNLREAFKVFFLFLLLHLVFNIVSWYTSYRVIHNLPLYHAITVVEFAFYSFMYFGIAKQARYKKTILLIIVLFTTFCVLNAIYLEDVYTDYNSNTRAVASLVLMIYAISYFYRMLKELTVETVEQEDMFWFNAGVLLYFAGTFFLSLFLKVFFDVAEKTEAFKDFLHQIYYLQYFLYVILNLLIAKAIWVSQPSK